MSLDPASYNHKFAFVNSINLHYVDEGSPSSPAIVLCHGWPDLWYGWRYQIKPLAAAGFRVIVPDLRGFGQTDAPPNYESYSFKHITNDLAALLDHLKIPQAVFLGHDWGGEVVWKMCLYHPNRVIAVGGVCTPFVPRHEEFVPLDIIVQILPAFAYQQFLISSDAPVFFNNNVEKFFRVMYRSSKKVDSLKGFSFSKDGFDKLEYPTLSDMMSQAEMDYYVGQYKKTGFEGGLNYYKTRKVNWDLEAGLPRTIQHRTLMLTAGKDIILTPKMAAGMKNTVPNLTMAHIEEAAHWILMEQPAEANRIILSWLNSLGLPKANKL